MTDHIVVGDRVLLDASFHPARGRLGILARDGMLLWASEVAYGQGITGLVKMAGPAAGLTRLAGAHLGDLAETVSPGPISARSYPDVPQGLWTLEHRNDPG